MKACVAILVCSLAIACKAGAQPKLQALPIETVLDAPVLAAWQPVALAADHAYVAYAACNPKKKLELEEAARAAGIAYEYGERWYFGCRLELTDTKSGATRTLASESSNGHGLSWSPDGKRLAYALGVGTEQRLYLWDRDSNTSRRVSGQQIFLHGSSTPVWLPDSRHLLVLVPQEKRAPAPSSAAPSPQSAPASTTVKLYRSAAATSDRTAPPAGPWALNPGGVSLVLVDTASGELRVILPEAPQKESLKYIVSPDGRSVAYARATRFAGPATQQTLMDVHVVTLSNGQGATLARDVPMLFGWGLSWSPDSRSLAWVTTGTLAPYDVSVHDLASGKTRTIRYAEKTQNARESSLTRMWPIDANAFGVSSPVWNANGRELYVMDRLQRAVWKVRLHDGSVTALLRIPGEQVLGYVHYGRSFPGAPRGTNALQIFTGNEQTKRVSLHEVDLARDVSRKLWSEDAKISDAVGSADGQALAYVQQRADASPDVWLRAMPAGQARQISRITTDFETYVFGKSRLIEWTTARGERLQGAVILPADYVAQKRYPLIVFPYGGGYKSHGLHHFAGGEGVLMATTDNMQLLATRGYAVLLPDVPARVGTIMKDYADAVLPGVDEAIAVGIADPDRLGVMGHSNGGYTVMGLIVQTTRFKAAVSRAGFSDYASVAFAMNADGSNYGLNIAEDLQLGGSLWEARSRWIDNSPLFLFDRVQTPTLIVHGGADSSVPTFAADQSFVALRRLDKVVEYARYENEKHNEELWSYSNRIDYLTRVIGWFDRFLCPQRPSETACN